MDTIKNVKDLFVDKVDFHSSTLLECLDIYKITNLFYNPDNNSSIDIKFDEDFLKILRYSNDDYSTVKVEYVDYLYLYKKILEFGSIQKAQVLHISTKNVFVQPFGSYCGFVIAVDSDENEYTCTVPKDFYVYHLLNAEDLVEYKNLSSKKDLEQFYSNIRVKYILEQIDKKLQKHVRSNFGLKEDLALKINYWQMFKLTNNYSPMFDRDFCNQLIGMPRPKENKVESKWISEPEFFSQHYELEIKVPKNRNEEPIVRVHKK